MAGDRDTMKLKLFYIVSKWKSEAITFYIFKRSFFPPKHIFRYHYLYPEQLNRYFVKAQGKKTKFSRPFALGTKKKSFIFYGKANYIRWTYVNNTINKNKWLQYVRIELNTLIGDSVWIGCARWKKNNFKMYHNQCVLWHTF